MYRRMNAKRIHIFISKQSAMILKGISIHHSPLFPYPTINTLSYSPAESVRDCDCDDDFSLSVRFALHCVVFRCICSNPTRGRRGESSFLSYTPLSVYVRTLLLFFLFPIKFALLDGIALHC